MAVGRFIFKDLYMKLKPSNTIRSVGITLVRCQLNHAVPPGTRAREREREGGIGA